MNAARSVLTGDIIEAYRTHGTVWAAGKALGISGQDVWERLRQIGHPMAGAKWTDDELAEMELLAATCTISEVARRLGRPYAGVATKMSRHAIRSAPRRALKIPRGAGFDKVSVAKHMKALDAYAGPFTRYCRANSLSVELLARSIQRDNYEWWNAYVKARGTIPSRKCNYCERDFYPSSGKQRACSRQCQGTKRVDEAYFGGNRRNTIGLAEGVCQLCARVDAPGLSAHHAIGKEADPENALLIALCPGCHQLVSQLAGRTFIATNEGWEALINLVMLRHAAGEHTAYRTTVEIEKLSEQDVLEMEEYA